MQYSGHVPQSFAGGGDDENRPPASSRRFGFAYSERNATSCSPTLSAARCGFRTTVIGDPVIVRADGHPAYNFAVVVDDALMEMTHVIRARITSRIRRGSCCSTRRSASRRRSSRTWRSSWDRSQPAVEASRRDVGRRVPREGLSARGARQLPRVDRLVAPGSDDVELMSDRRARAPVFARARSATARACSTRRSWPG